MATGSSIQIGVDTITKLTQLVALHGVYALLVIFMFYFESRARRNILDATKPDLSKFFRNQYVVIIIMIIVLTSASTVIWTYSTFFYEPKVVVEGTFKGLIDQPKVPIKAGDAPLLVDTIAPFKSDDHLFTLKRVDLKNDQQPDVDWVFIAPAGEKTLVLAFEQQYDLISPPDPGAVRVADSTEPSTTPVHDSSVLQRFAYIDLQVHPSLRRGVLQMLYKPSEKDRCRGVGKLFILAEGDKFAEIPLVEQERLVPKPDSAATATTLDVNSAWADDLDQRPSKIPELPDESKLASYLGSQDLQKQIKAQQILIANGSKALPLILNLVKNSTEVSSSSRALLIHNLAVAVDKIESSNSENNSELHAELGKALYEVGDYQAASIQFKKIPAAEADPTILLIKGASELKTSDTGGALVDFESILARSKDSHLKSLALGNIGGMYLTQGKLPEARKSLADALALDSSNSNAKYNLGLLELRSERYDAAASIFRSIAKLNPNQVGAKVSLALALQRQGKLKEATDVLEDALQTSPDNAAVLNNLAFGYALQGIKLGDALAYSERALAVDGGSAHYLDTKGWILHLQGKDKESIAYLKKAADKMPGDITIRKHLQAVQR